MAAEEVCCKPMFFVYLFICVGLVMFAGLMSGLTLGLMSLSLVDLEVLVKAGTPKDRSNAAKILPVVKNQHLLLCTLLIGNSLAMEALPIFLDALVPAWVAVLISVTLILAFGEILPQAVCTRYGLSVGAKMAGVVRLLLLVFFPVAYPISKLLDRLLGKGRFTLLRRAELKTLVDMHGNEAGKGGELTHDETTIITGALELTQKTAKDAMTTISETFALSIDSKLDMSTMGLIMNEGHSRVPIYSGEPTNIIGLILVKNLIRCRPEDEIPVRNVIIRRIHRVHEDMPLYDILNEFQKGLSHMAVVVKLTKDAAGASTAAGKISRTRNVENKNNKEFQVDGDGSQIIDIVTVPSMSNVYGNPSGTRNVESKNNKDSQGDGSQIIDIITVTSMCTNTSGNPTPLRNMDQSGDARRPLKKRASRRHENILDDLGSLPSYPGDEEVVGIITMEDVMEELLQEEILDETDEYVDVHNKIKINMLPPTKQSTSSRSSPKSPGTFPRFPRKSPLSPYGHTSAVYSPISQSTKGPGLTPRAFKSPGKSFSSSPIDHGGSGFSPSISNDASQDEKKIP